MSHIVALIDFSDMPLAAEVVGAARRLAVATHRRLCLLNVEMPDANVQKGGLRADISRKAIARELRSKHRALQILRLASQHLGVEAAAMMVRSKSVRGNAAGKVLQELDRLKPEIVVVGSHGRGALHRLFVGSVSEAVIRHAHLPVLVIPAPKGVPRQPQSAAAQSDAPVETSIVSIR